MLMRAQRQAAVAGAAQPLKTGLKPKGSNGRFATKRREKPFGFVFPGFISTLGLAQK